MRIEPKPQEVIEAQVAAFADESVNHGYDKGHVINNLSQIAAGDVVDVTRVVGQLEHSSKDGRLISIPEGTERTITATDYLSFLRSKGGADYVSIQVRSEISSAYDNTFKGMVDNLKRDLALLDNNRESPSFIGSGLSSEVFKIRRDDKDYAVRIPKGIKINPHAIDQHLAGMALGIGIPGMEQIVAASYQDGVTVAEIMPGKEMGKSMTPEDMDNVTDDQLSRFVDTLTIAHGRGVEIDPKPSNIFYDKDHGFGVVDYGSSREAGKNSKDQTLGEVVGWMATPIMNAGFYGRPYKEKTTPEDYAVELVQIVANLRVLDKFRHVVKGKLLGEDREEALFEIDKKIALYQEIVRDYSSPEWVENTIMRDMERKLAKEAERARYAEYKGKDIVELDLV